MLRVVAQSRWVSLRVSLAALMACLSLAPSRAADGDAPQFRRGIAIAQDMGWAPVDPSSRDFTFPPFEASTETLRRDLKVIHDAGFDFVRLAVDPGPFLRFDGTRRDRLDDMLLERIKLVRASGLSVIVDFHPSDLHQDYTAEALTKGPDTPSFQAYLQLLGRTAALLNPLRSRAIALELMNEPPVTPARWQPMLAAAYAAVRKRAPHLQLVLEGGNEGGADGLLALNAFRGDQDALLSFHYYDAYQFTHQGAPWVAARYLADVPYPALSRPLQDSLDASGRLIGASELGASEKSAAMLDARRRLADYRNSAFDRSSIARSFDRIARWAREHQVSADRIILGEFGVMKGGRGLRGARKDERARWLRDVREEAEAHRFIWAAWDYQDTGGFSLVRGAAEKAFDPLVIEALGLQGS